MIKVLFVLAAVCAIGIDGYSEFVNIIIIITIMCLCSNSNVDD